MNNIPSIGIMGGSFDPVHYGHLLIAEWVKEVCNLSQIIFIPANCSPFKRNGTSANTEDRYNMLRIAIADNPAFGISRIDIDRPPPSYTVDTLEILSKDIKCNLHFILGTDAFVEIKKWRNYKKILELTQIIVLPRQQNTGPIYNNESMNEWLNDNLSDYTARIKFIDMPLFSISSSLIRERIRNKISVHYMLPDKVMDYIIENSIY